MVSSIDLHDETSESQAQLVVAEHSASVVSMSHPTHDPADGSPCMLADEHTHARTHARTPKTGNKEGKKVQGTR